MFDINFYPTPKLVIEQMLNGFDVASKTILEPSAGKGDIVDFLQKNGANVIACENHPELATVVSSKCKLIGNDFFKVKGDMVSHVDMIVMNPPYITGADHILHAWEIAPEGCDIIALCNWQTIKNSYSNKRKELFVLIQEHGSSQSLGDCFTNSERGTGVEVGLVMLKKPGEGYNQEFDGFFMEEEDEPENQMSGIMPYNFVRDLVNRYVGAIRLFDRQLDLGVEMNTLTGSFYNSDIAFKCTEKEKPVTRNEYKKDLQKQAWLYVFRKMNMGKLSTKGLKEDINKFVEQQTEVPFTMRNIYRMIEIVIATTDQRMDKALLEVFDRLTKHHHENRYQVEGWKTNSHYMLNMKFILPWVTEVSWGGNLSLRVTGNYEYVEDMQKALCFLTGTSYDDLDSLWSFFHKYTSNGDKTQYYFNTWYKWGFFEIKGFKKGTMHFRFLDESVWAKFNQRIAKIKGYPLWEKSNDYYSKKQATAQ